MTRCTAIYTRFSNEQQRPTSIDDQIRRCQEIARQNGLSTDNVCLYQDAAVTGKASGDAKREGFKKLLEDWDRGAFDVLIVDEFSRLSRDALTQAQIIRRLESNQRVRMLSANGTDTAKPNWQLPLGLEGIVSQQAGRDTRHRVVRGMLGQLERGYMIASPALGYSLKREFDAAGNHIGTHWEIHENDAAVVREVFERRAQGETMHAIARDLNERGIATCSGTVRSAKAKYWRPSRIRNLLSNRVYKGEFVWNGSTTARSRAAKAGYEVEEQVFERPQLRIVSDETWERCNRKTISRSGYGGGRHALAGLINCGCCDSILAVTSQRRCRSIYCSRCTVAKSVTGVEGRLTGTVAVTGVQQVLIEAARSFLSPAFVEAFKQRLQAKLLGNVDAELTAARNELVRLEGAQERLSRLVAADETEDPVLLTRYTEARDRARAQREEVQAIAAGMENVDRAAIEAQLKATDPLKVLEGLFDADLPPARVRAILARLFPSIVLEEKRSKYQSVFLIRFAPGTALALASDTQVVANEEVELRFLLRYRPSHISGDARWTVEQVKTRSPNRSRKTPAVDSPAVTT